MESIPRNVSDDRNMVSGLSSPGTAQSSEIVIDGQPNDVVSRSFPEHERKEPAVNVLDANGDSLSITRQNAKSMDTPKHVEGIIDREEVITTSNAQNPLDTTEANKYSNPDHEVPSSTSAVVIETGDVVGSTGEPQGSLNENNHDRVHSPALVQSPRSPEPLHLDLKSTAFAPQPWDADEPLNSLAGHKMNYQTSPSALQHVFPTHPTRPLKPKSSYYFGPPPADSAFGKPPVGQIGVHYPREIVRIERDYSGGELPQFAAIYPLEFEGRISPTQFLESINAINEILISAHSLRHGFLDNVLATFSLQLSKLLLKTHYDKEMERLLEKIKLMNETLYNPVGLNIVWPRNVAFLFLEIEYY